MSNVPKLRFREFDYPWINTRLGNYFTEYREKSTVQDQHPVMTSSNKGLVLQLDYFGEGRIVDRDNIGFNVIPESYITYRSRSDNRSFTFNINNLGVTGIISTYYPVFKLSDGNDAFFTYLMSFYQKFIGRFSVGTSQTVLSFNELKRIKLPIPSSEEQQKIADFLSAVDSKIEQLTRKEELLKQYKKGVMQKIFSQEIRFKADDGSEFPEWEYLNGNELFQPISNKDHNSDLPVLAITQEHGAIPRDLIDYQISVTEKSVSTYKVVEVGDFIISLRSFQGGIEYSNYKGICSPAYIILRKTRSLNDRFYKAFLKTDHYIKLMNMKIEGIRDGKMISFKQFSEVKLPLPCSEEQGKIANLFLAIDEKLKIASRQLESARTFKKGLLQQMFV